MRLAIVNSQPSDNTCVNVYMRVFDCVYMCDYAFSHIQACACVFVYDVVCVYKNVYACVSRTTHMKCAYIFQYMRISIYYLKNYIKYIDFYLWLRVCYCIYFRMFLYSFVYTFQYTICIFICIYVWYIYTYVMFLRHVFVSVYIFIYIFENIKI